MLRTHYYFFRFWHLFKYAMRTFQNKLDTINHVSLWMPNISVNRLYHSLSIRAFIAFRLENSRLILFKKKIEEWVLSTVEKLIQYFQINLQYSKKSLLSAKAGKSLGEVNPLGIGAYALKTELIFSHPIHYIWIKFHFRFDFDS